LIDRFNPDVMIGTSNTYFNLWEKSDIRSQRNDIICIICYRAKKKAVPVKCSNVVPHSLFLFVHIKYLIKNWSYAFVLRDALAVFFSRSLAAVSKHLFLKFTTHFRFSFKFIFLIVSGLSMGPGHGIGSLNNIF